MKPQNLRSMFAASAMLCEKALNNEIVELSNANIVLDNLKFMRDCIELGHKQTLSKLEYGELYDKVWNELSPQTKLYDALPE